MHQSAGFNLLKETQGNDRQSDSEVRRGISFLTTVAICSRSLRIDKSEGHKIQSAGPSVKTHLPPRCRYTSLPPPLPADSSHFPAATGKICEASPLQMRRHWFCVNPPGRSNLIRYQRWLNETSPGRSRENGGKRWRFGRFFSPQSTSTCVVSFRLRHQRPIFTRRLGEYNT